jgi:hypothetical protein
MKIAMTALLLIALWYPNLVHAQGEKLTVTGKLVRAASIGGESTDWLIEFPAAVTVEGQQIHSIQVSSHDTSKLEKFANKNVTAAGTVLHQQGTETDHQLVLETLRSNKAPRLSVPTTSPSKRKACSRS